MNPVIEGKRPSCGRSSLLIRSLSRKPARPALRGGASVSIRTSLRPRKNQQNKDNAARSGSLLDRESGFHPPLLSLGIVRHVRVTHGRQFTGGVFAGVSMRVRAVGNDLNILGGQQLRCEFFDLFRWDIQGSGNVGVAVAFRRSKNSEVFLGDNT